MPFVHPRKKPTLSVTDMALSVEQQRKAMFDGWIDECAGIQEAFIEGLLVQIELVHGREA
jgi:hypothetical protein